MKQSRRAIRMERHHKRNGRIPALNLVSLMDIFTILVFFLLVNSSSGKVLPTSKNIELPQSFAETLPRYNLTLVIDGASILIEGQKISALADDGTNNAPIPKLSEYLAAQHQKIASEFANSKAPAQEITIMGDKSLPYHLLKRIMLSCTSAGFERISFAVLQKSAGSSQ